MFRGSTSGECSLCGGLRKVPEMLGFCKALGVLNWNGARRGSERFPGRPGKFPGLASGSRRAFPELVLASGDLSEFLPGATPIQHVHNVTK